MRLYWEYQIWNEADGLLEWTGIIDSDKNRLSECNSENENESTLEWMNNKNKFKNREPQ